MSNRRKKLTSAQCDLPLENRYGAFSGVLKKAAALLAKAIRSSGYSREQICDQLSYLLGRPVTVALLNAWTAESNKNQMPADVMFALCDIPGEYEPINLILSASGQKVSDKTDLAFMEMGRISIARESLNQREQAARMVLAANNKSGGNS